MIRIVVGALMPAIHFVVVGSDDLVLVVAVKVQYCATVLLLNTVVRACHLSLGTYFEGALKHHSEYTYACVPSLLKVECLR